MRGLQNEAERELVEEETHETGGPAHRSASERDGEERSASREPPARARSAEEEEYARAVRRATDEQDRDPPAAPADDAAR